MVTKSIHCKIASVCKYKMLPSVHSGLTVYNQLDSWYTPHRFRRDYPLNLSISVSGGRESKRDSLSSGERKGNSPAHNLLGYQAGGEILRKGKVGYSLAHTRLMCLIVI